MEQGYELTFTGRSWTIPSIASGKRSVACAVPVARSSFFISSLDGCRSLRAHPLVRHAPQSTTSNRLPAVGTTCFLTLPSNAQSIELTPLCVAGLHTSKTKPLPIRLALRWATPNAPASVAVDQRRDLRGVDWLDALAWLKGKLHTNLDVSAHANPGSAD